MLGVLFLNPLRAWWDDDAGNRALLVGNTQQAIARFNAGLRLEPNWGLLHEDRGRALMDRDPKEALAEFERAACGLACLAEEGDALAAMGRMDEAIDRYIAAKAVGRTAEVARHLTGEGNYDAALAIEAALIKRLHNNFIDRADLAAAYATTGTIQVSAALAAADPALARTRGRLAVDAFFKASNLAPLNEDYLLSYGFAQLRFGNQQQARAAFERLLRIHPDQPDAQAALRRMQGDKKDAP